MIRFLRKRARRFMRREDGTATVEFSIVFLPMFMMLISAVELGFVQLHHVMLERALDMTVRDIRLGTGSAPQHDDIKNTICSRAGFIDDCSDLRLEMVVLDPRAWTGIPAVADCRDQSQPVAPVRSFVNGLDNELMFLRACAKFDPIFPMMGLGKDLIKDGAGRYALVSTSAFVQEPR
ncbi:TadE/TadG family type IV pilus assembly protein [Thalassococcus sp. S3]|uniref:TadE/TadG family type IV pilus assembly protein n=1 Tax=Thalassococcus sp. S3 TaxID=2017482 RepID=UPI0010243314|nr:TadE family protein [Thalassococcus sp. S3]QBF31207.1 pilus assembly protein TadE [Thalassococcus sp. S3]